MGTSASLQQGQIPVSCKLCTTETKIAWKCLDCDIYMCDKCKERKHSKNHRVVNVKDIGQELHFKSFACHTGNVYATYCQSCDQLVCPPCITKFHSSHTFVDLSDAQKRKTSILRGRLKVLSDEKVKIKKLKADEVAKYTKVKNQIKEHSLSLKKAIDLLTDQLLVDLDKKLETFVDSLDKAESRIVVLEKSETDKIHVQKIEDVINSNNTEQIFEESKTLKESFQEVLNLCFISNPVFEPGEISQCNLGKLKDIQFKFIKEYTTDISKVRYMSPCQDSLWISDHKVLQKVKPEINNLKVTSNFNIPIMGMAVTPSNDLLLAPQSGSVLKQININTNNFTETNYIIDQQGFTAIHVTSDDAVMVGVRDFATFFPVTGRRAMIKMDKKGKIQTIYEYDKNNQHLFSLVRCITTTNKGNICVVDILSSDWQGRVVVFSEQTREIIKIYTGHPEVNTNHRPFKPISIATTPSDNLVVSDMKTGVLHILNNTGHFITYIKIRDIGIEWPLTINFSSAGKVYIGCSISDKAKLYEVNLTGC